MASLRTPHGILDALVEAGVVPPERRLSLFHSRVRDRDDISVFRCEASDVFILSSVDHVEGLYENMQPSQYWNKDGSDVFSLEQAVQKCHFDDKRRTQQFATILSGKVVLDVGCGAGGFSIEAAYLVSRVDCVEPQPGIQDFLTKKVQKPLNVYKSLSSAPSNYYDVVTMFHSFEHFSRPRKELEGAFKALKVGGFLIIEVPHARDFLIEVCEAFRNFTFWSEHLILHTRESLKKLVESAGFVEIEVRGFQRYPLSNHLYWLAAGRPGGHLHWPHMNSCDLDRAYQQMLAALDKTDTIILTACKR